MFATLVSVALFSSIAIKGVRADLTIDTPSLVQCQPAVITWTDDGSGPYDVIVVPSNDVCSEELADLGVINGTSTTWIVDISSGENVTFSLQDSVGNEAWSGSTVVGQSSNSSCLSAASSAVPSATVSLYPTGEASASGIVNDAPATSSSTAQVVGAASSGDGTSAGFTMHQLNAPVMILSALAAFAIVF